MSDLTIGEVENWFKTEFVANKFKCSESAIRECKRVNSDKLVEGIHWKRSTVSKLTVGGEPPIVWSLEGVMELSKLMSRTEEAINLRISIEVDKAKKEIMANVIPMIQTLQEDNLKMRDELYRTERTFEAYVYDVKKTAMFSENKTNINIKAVKKMLEQFKQDQYWRTDLKHLTVLEFVEACNLEGMLPKPQLRTLAKVAIYWSKKFKADIDPRGQNRLSLIYGGKGDVLNVGIRTDVMFMVWDMQNTMIPSYIKKQKNLYDAHKRGS